MNALTDLADRLIPLPVSERKENLRKGLIEIEAALLPSSVTYFPLGNSHHRVKHIVVEESFVFSTKERVPYLICVEVVDYLTSSKAVNHSQNCHRKESKLRPGVGSEGFSYTVKLPFNKAVTLAMTPSENKHSSVDNAVINETGNQGKGESKNIVVSNSATAYKQQQNIVASNSASAKFSSTISTVPLCPQTDSRESTKTFVIQSFQKCISVSFEERLDNYDEDSSLELVGAPDNESESEKVMGQWAHRSGCSKQFKKDASTSEECQTARLQNTLASYSRELPSPECSSDLGEEDVSDKIEGVQDVTYNGGLNANKSKPVIVFRERWSEKENRLRPSSSCGSLPGWRLIPVIVKR